MADATHSARAIVKLAKMIEAEVYHECACGAEFTVSIPDALNIAERWMRECGYVAVDPALVERARTAVEARGKPSLHHCPGTEHCAVCALESEADRALIAVADAVLAQVQE